MMAIVIVSLCVGLFCGWFGAIAFHNWDGKEELEAISELDLTMPAGPEWLAFHQNKYGGKSFMDTIKKPSAEEPVEFAVTAKPRHIPWSIRKKELEADARQKRRAREEFREQS